MRSPTAFTACGVAALAVLLTGSLAASLAGCAAPATRGPMTSGPVPASVLVIAQVCFPAGLDRQLISVETVQVASTGGGGEPLTGRTSAAQPVFQFFTAHPSELRAVLVRYMKPDGALTDHFVFEPPSRVEYDGWTAWQPASAVAVNGNWSVGTGMVNGVKPALKPVPPAAPLVRYRLMPFEQYLADVRRRRDSGLDVDLPRCEAGGGGA